jgi:DNA-binding LacI/PurR family transcriptional regulator
LPVVQVIRPQLAIATATITVDPAPGITAAIDHLIGLGHRTVTFIGRGGPYPIDRARLDSFTAALARHALAPAERDVLLVSNYAVELAYKEMRTRLASTDLPTAVFAAGDNLALGVLRALYEARLRVPDDVSLVSYDDVFAADLYPPLASVVQPLAEVGERAVTLLTERLDSANWADCRPIHITLPTSFITRASTCPPHVVPARYRGIDGVRGGIP